MENEVKRCRDEVKSFQAERASMLDERSELRKSIVALEQAFLVPHLNSMCLIL